MRGRSGWKLKENNANKKVRAKQREGPIKGISLAKGKQRALEVSGGSQGIEGKTGAQSTVLPGTISPKPILLGNSCGISKKKSTPS